MNATIRVLVVAAILAVPTAGHAQTINIGTLAPEGSLWHEVLLKMGQRWKEISGGSVTLRIYPGGIEGPEPTMLRKVAIGQLHAVALSSAGLAEIDKGVTSLSIPMLYESYSELDYVRQRIEPDLEKRIADKGYVVLHWSDVGFVRFFTKTPARTLDDIRKMRLFVSAGDPDTEALYKKFGFNVVPSEVTAMVEALKTNRISAFDVPPLFALLDQSFAASGNMIDVKWAPVTAATVIQKRAWDRIPAALQPKLLEAARQAAAEYRAQIRKMEDDAVAEMKKRKLNVITLDAPTLASWKQEADKAYPSIRGSVVPADLFDRARQLITEIRSKR